MAHVKSGEQLFEDLEKVRKVYESCKTSDHIASANRMFKAFINKWQKVINPKIVGDFFLKSLEESSKVMINKSNEIAKLI